MGLFGAVDVVGVFGVIDVMGVFVSLTSTYCAGTGSAAASAAFTSRA
jgi:hypothetical protein